MGDLAGILRAAGKPVNRSGFDQRGQHLTADETLHLVKQFSALGARNVAQTGNAGRKAVKAGRQGKAGQQAMPDGRPVGAARMRQVRHRAAVALCAGVILRA